MDTKDRAVAIRRRGEHQDGRGGGHYGPIGRANNTKLNEGQLSPRQSQGDGQEKEILERDECQDPATSAAGNTIRLDEQIN